MNHHHDHQAAGEASWGRRLVITMVLNLVIPLVQIAGGIISGSMALISDALHNLGDFVSVVLSYGALRLGRHGATARQTFGYKRVEVLATLVNVALLYGIALFIAVEAGKRLFHPEPIRGGLVIGVALLGFAANILSTWLLHAGARENINIRSAFLHMLTDALTSLGVAVLGIIWIYKPWYWLDPLVSWAIVALILYSGLGLLKEAYRILMNATPPGIDLIAIRTAIHDIEGIKNIHDLHVWSASAESIALAVHITVADQMLSSVDGIAERVRDLLFHQFGIDHPILQFEADGCGENDLFCHPVRHGHRRPEGDHASGEKGETSP